MCPPLPPPPRGSIHEIIGRGRQSKVYKARLKQSLEYVVVKACAKDLKPRVLQEVWVGCRRCRFHCCASVACPRH